MTIEGFCQKYRTKARRDTDGTWIVPGRHGQIYEYDEQDFGVILMFPNCPRQYGFARKRLLQAGMHSVHNGESEGSLSFNPSDDAQAVVAIREAKIRRKRVPSTAVLATLARVRPATQFGRPQRGQGRAHV